MKTEMYFQAIQSPTINCVRQFNPKQKRRKYLFYRPFTKRKSAAWGTCDKAVFCINECKVLLYLFNNKLIIEKKKNYAIIKS